MRAPGPGPSVTTMPPAHAPQEAARLHALQSYAILDTPPEDAFDQLATLAARVCGCPMAVVNFVDSERQWFKAAVGVPFAQTDRAIAFCVHALDGNRDAVVVPDARQHPAFAGNPLVVGEPRVRFYACVPLVTPEGFALGTLAVLDTVPDPEVPALSVRDLGIVRVSGGQAEIGKAQTALPGNWAGNRYRCCVRQTQSGHPAWHCGRIRLASSGRHRAWRDPQ